MTSSNVLRHAKSALVAIILLAWLIPLGGCGPKFEEMSAQQIYEYGEQEYANRDFQDALDAYNALIDLYPFSVHVTDSELRVADCNYERRRWAEAEVAYDSFLKRHPNHTQADHALYRQAMCEYKQKLAIDRDQSSTQQAEHNFSRLVSRYPQSQYLAEAQQRLAEVRGDLAERERYVARVYWRQDEYYASYKRWERIIRLFSDTEYYEEALFYAARCLIELDEQVEAKRLLQMLLTKFPEGDYAKKARELLARLE